MATIIKKLNKKTGITYVYESESYWDKEKKQARSNRKLVGKIDPETGEIVPTRGKAEKKTVNVSKSLNSVDTQDERYLNQEKLIREKNEEISKLNKRIDELSSCVEDYRIRLTKIEEISHL